MKVLLLTDIPPSTNYTAGLVLAQACKIMPRGSIVCFSIVNPELQNIELDPDLAWLPLEFAPKPNEMGLPREARFGLGISYLKEEARRRLFVPQLVKLAADFARRQNVDTIWAVLQGQTMVQVTRELTSQLNLPLHTQVWDPLSWWLDSHLVDRWHKKRSLAEFDEVMKRSKSCATASWAMSQEYETRYGVRCVPLIACHAREEARHPEPKLRRADEVVLGMAGQFYAAEEWQQLLQAMNAVNWSIEGRQVRIKVLGHYVPSSSIPAGRCEFLGWKPQAEAIRILSEQTDILYCPYPSQHWLSEVTRLSFPSKLVTYFAAGRPVLFHGPDFASPARFLAERRAGLVAVGMGSTAAYNALYRLVTEPELYAEIARNAQAVFASEFTLEQMKSRLLEFLGTTEADLAAAPAARVAFDSAAPAAFLPGPRIVRSRLMKIRGLGLHLALRVPVLRGFAKGTKWLLLKKRHLDATRLERRRLRQEQKAERSPVTAIELREILHDQLSGRTTKTVSEVLLQQKTIEAQLEKFVQAFDAVLDNSGSVRDRPDNLAAPLDKERLSLSQREILESQLEGTKRAYSALGEQLLDVERRYNTMLASVSARLSMMQWGALQPGGQARLAGTYTTAAARYLDLLERCLTGTLIKDVSISPWVQKGFDPELRLLGRDWPEHAQTMIGTVRMRNVRYLLEKIIENNIAGDVIETGVWRGGACIYMQAILVAHNQTDRAVWVADSFAGLPVADVERYPLDANDIHHTFQQLAISLEEVQANFARYNLLDQNVRFLKGWFEDTLPSAPIERLAILRLDGDMYSSTIQALDALYHKVSLGGFVIVDDYILPACRKAVDEFRATHGINDEIQEIDGAAVYWQKSN